MLNRLLRPCRAHRPRGHRPDLEVLEDRSLPSTTPFFFSTGTPDGKIATATRPANGPAFEIESADDFILPTETVLTNATFTGLIPTNATVSEVVLEIYRVFPKDSDVGRTSGPPVFSTTQVPTRVNSPSDIAFLTRDSMTGGLMFTTTPLSTLTGALNSVQPGGIHPKPSQTTGGNGALTGMQEVQFNISLPAPFSLDLPADHYFFVPQVLLSTGNFFWLSAAKPIVAPGTPFSPDLQSWTRDANLDPDWLRIGTDIVGGTPAPTFNAAFSLTGTSITPSISSLSQNSAPEGSGNLTLLVNGADFTSSSTVLFNGNPLATTFVSGTQLSAVVPAGRLSDEGTATVSVFDPLRTLSNTQTFSITDNTPTASASLSQTPTGRSATISDMFSDSTAEDHHLRINWGDGTSSDVDLGVSASSPFALGHSYSAKGPRTHVITVTVVDDDGVASAPLVFIVAPHKGGHHAGRPHHVG
jgi:hypothetical protein